MELEKIKVKQYLWYYFRIMLIVNFCLNFNYVFKNWIAKFLLKYNKYLSTEMIKNTIFNSLIYKNTIKLRRKN